MSELARPPFARTAHVVVASASEVYGIWHRWSHVYGVEMGQEPTTTRAVIGEIAGHPIEVRVTWYRVGGQRVAFVDPISEVVDRRRIDAWIRESFFPDVPASEAALRISDAADFQIVLARIFHEVGRPIPMRDLVALDRAIERVPVQPRGGAKKKGESDLT